MKIPETIEWIPVADELPDAETSVLIAMQGGSEPTWIGWYDGARWYDTEGQRALNVTHWAHMLEGPKG